MEQKYQSLIINNIHTSVEISAANTDNGNSDNLETSVLSAVSNSSKETANPHINTRNCHETCSLAHGNEPLTLNSSFTNAPVRSFAFRQEYLKELKELELYNEPIYHNTWTSQTPSRAQSSLQRYGEHRPGNYSFHSHHSFVSNLFNRSHSQITRPHMSSRIKEMQQEKSNQPLIMHDAREVNALKEEEIARDGKNGSSALELATVGQTSTQDEEEHKGENVDAAITEETHLPEFAIEDIEDEAISQWEPSERWPHCIQHIARFAHWYVSRLTGYDQSLNLYGFYPSWDQLVAFIFTCLTLIILGLIEHYGFHPLINQTLHIFIPAFGASATVVFAVPKAPIAQPRAVFLSHIFAAFIGVCLANALHGIPNTLWGECAAGALGVGLHLALMQITNTLHPPASATVISAALTPLNEYYHDQGFLFVLSPVALGSVYVILMACLLNNIVIARSPYPQY